MKRIIGIDLGVTTTYMKYRDYNENENNSCVFAQPVKVQGCDSVPTCAFVCGDDFSREENFIFGNNAETNTLEGTFYPNFKLGLLSKDDIEKSKSLQLLNYYLKWLRRAYEEHSVFLKKCENESTYIGCPLRWMNKDVVSALKTAAERAGFKNVVVVDETTAAIHGLLYDKVEELQRSGIIAKNNVLNVIVCDTGAEITDVMFGRYYTNDERVEPLISYPNSQEFSKYGGRMFDERIRKVFCDYMYHNGVDFEQIPLVSQEKWIKNFKNWKERNLSYALSLNNKEKMPKVPQFISSLLKNTDENIVAFPDINREWFEYEFSNEINEFVDLINNAIDYAGHMNSYFLHENIDLIILTGGNSRWYFTKEILTGKLTAPNGKCVNIPKVKDNSIRLLQMENPSEAVASGLTYNPTQKVEINDVSRYNIWFQASVGETKFPPKLLVKKNEILPFEDNQIIYAEDVSIEQIVLTNVDMGFILFAECSLFVSPSSIDVAKEYKEKITIKCLPGSKVSYRWKQGKAIKTKEEYFIISDTVSIALKFSTELDAEQSRQSLEVKGMIACQKHDNYYVDFYEEV